MCSSDLGVALRIGQGGINIARIAVGEFHISDICADGSWAYTVCSWMYGKYGREEYLVMQDAIDSFRYKTESDYIPRSRLEELATQWKDKIIQDCWMTEEEQNEYFIGEQDMDDAELEFFGLLKGDDE